MITMSAGRWCAVLCREKEERKAQACQQVNVNFKKEWNRKKKGKKNPLCFKRNLGSPNTHKRWTTKVHPTRKTTKISRLSQHVNNTPLPKKGLNSATKKDKSDKYVEKSTSSCLLCPRNTPHFQSPETEIHRIPIYQVNGNPNPKV